ncbi:hypothetical protein, partial [Salmonella enterica]|uniref:hypothetical protein n=1 Tax=Salmonella enterica TaxID=28901 RepID=UPI00398C78B4
CVQGCLSKKRNHQETTPSNPSAASDVYKSKVSLMQLRPFASKAEASALQQRLQTEPQLQSFIAIAQ